MKRAFTLLEVIVVIVVLGIVAAISAEIIAKMYERYLLNRGISRLESKTQQALDIIAKRLQYRVKETAIARISSTPGSDFKALADANDSYRILEWFGYDNDGRLGKGVSGYNVPGWSGFCDLIPSNGTTIVSPGSHFSTIEKNISEALTQDVSIDGSRAQLPAVIFKGSRGELNVTKFGWGGGDHNYSIRVRSTGETTLQMLEKPDFISERYLLVLSAFALIPVGGDCTAALPQDCNLSLYYDFQPWEGETVNSANVKQSLLIDHITTFRFRQNGRTIHIKLCAMDAGLNRYLEENVSICKERVVY